MQGRKAGVQARPRAGLDLWRPLRGQTDLSWGRPPAVPLAPHEEARAARPAQLMQASLPGAAGRSDKQGPMPTARSWASLHRHLRRGLPPTGPSGSGHIPPRESTMTSPAEFQKNQMLQPAWQGHGKATALAAGAHGAGHRGAKGSESTQQRAAGSWRRARRPCQAPASGCIPAESHRCCNAGHVDTHGSAERVTSSAMQGLCSAVAEGPCRGSSRCRAGGCGAPRGDRRPPLFLDKLDASLLARLHLQNELVHGSHLRGRRTRVGRIGATPRPADHGQRRSVWRGSISIFRAQLERTMPNPPT